MLRRALVTVALGLLALTTACSGGIFGSVPSPSPVTAASVRAAVDNSTMDNAHFRVTGTLGIQGNHFPVTGDGVLEKNPTTALSLNLAVKTNTRAGTITVQEVEIGGMIYTRTGNGQWTSAPETSTFSPTAPTTYVGEEDIAGTTTWHARSADKGTSYDIWVRETDGYIVYLSFIDTKSSLSMNFDTYNQSALITVP
jgi:hypothetical protein